MDSEELKIRFPTGLEEAVHVTKGELEQQILLMAGLKMFELGKLSSGKAAELAGRLRVEFFEACGKYHVSIFNYSPQQVENEIDNDINTLRKMDR